jgi:hypothetical protein
VAKQHSFVHQHLNYIIWHLPFALLVSGAVGKAMHDLIRAVNPVLARRWWVAALGLLAIAYVGSVVRKHQYIAAITKESQPVAEVAGMTIRLARDFIAYHADDCSKVDETKSFFLDLIPVDPPDTRYEDNAPDRPLFYFRDLSASAVPLYPFSECVMVARFEPVPLWSIQTGQIDLRNRSKLSWERFFQLDGRPQ